MGLTPDGGPVPATPGTTERSDSREGDDAFAALGSWSGVLSRLLAGQPLSAEEAEVVLAQVLGGEATEAQVAALMTALRAKGESVEEMTGLVRAMLARAEPLTLPPPVADAVDLVGTGGDRLRSINVTTIAAFVTAGAGVPVCKHGNRAASSSVGTADVLEALGVVVELGAAGVTRCVVECGMGFCFAQRFHPAMRYVGPVRAQLGIPTVFNFLGPLAHPARVTRQLVGVSDPKMAPRMAGVLGANGSRRAMVVCADDGLDELSVTSPSTILELVADEQGGFDVHTTRLDPATLGLPVATMDDLRGGDAAFNARVIRQVLEGETGPRRDIAVLNAAAALVIAGRAPDLAEGLELARAAIDDGRALAVLDGLRAVSQEAAAEQAAAAAGGTASTSG